MYCGKPPPLGFICCSPPTGCIKLGEAGCKKLGEAPCPLVLVDCGDFGCRPAGCVKLGGRDDDDDDNRLFLLFAVSLLLLLLVARFDCGGATFVGSGASNPSAIKRLSISRCAFFIFAGLLL